MVISDRKQARGSLLEIANALLEAGCRWFSLREKDLPDSELRQLAQGILPVFEAQPASLSIHAADAVLASELGLISLHLPAGGDIAAARRLLGGNARIGISCHDGTALRRAAEEGADYATLSPLFETASKPGYPPLDRAQAAAWLADAPLPVLALGGIEGAEEAKACRRMGAAGLAVMGRVMRADDPAGAFTALKAAWRAGD